MKNDRRFYVYAHYRKSDGVIFYVGKGSGGRAFSDKGRNIHWLRISKKHGFYARIIKDKLSHQCAFSLERIIISVNWSKHMANISLGGDGSPYHTQETKNKISASRKGKKIPQEAQDRAALKLSMPVINSSGEIFKSVRDAQRKLQIKLGKKISCGALCDVLNGKHKYCYGLSWSYDVSKTPEHPVIKNRKRNVLCVETNEVHQGLVGATKWVRHHLGKSGSDGFLSDAIKFKKMAYGLHWRYV